MPKDVFTIADAKRGDIGNTAYMYAQTFFDPASSGLNFDSITVAPYMGHDSVEPFLRFENKWVILLALTSNPGSHDFQMTKSEDYIPMYERVMRLAQTWASPEELMFVIGATRADFLQKVREIAPDNFFLVPGVGAQGGSLEDVARYAMNSQVGLLVNSSRGIIYAGDNPAVDAKREAQKLQEEMAMHLDAYYIK